MRRAGASTIARNVALNAAIGIGVAWIAFIDDGRFMFSLDGGCHDLVVRSPHSVKLQRAHQIKKLCPFHQLTLLKLS